MSYIGDNIQFFRFGSKPVGIFPEFVRMSIFTCNKKPQT